MKNWYLEATDEQDAFSVLVDFAPDKLELVRETLVTFTNSNLKKINLSVTDLDTQVKLIMFFIERATGSN